MPISPHRFELSLLPGRLATSRLGPAARVAEWATRGSFFASPGRETNSRWSRSTLLLEYNGRQSSWRVFKIRGPFAPIETGVLSTPASPLAEAGISLFAISTFDTDCLLVASGTISAAIAALEQRAPKIHGSQEE